MSAALVGYNFSPIPSKISFYIKQNSKLSLPKKSQIIKPFDSQTESVSQEWLLPQASLSLPAATDVNSETPCLCASPSN